MFHYPFPEWDKIFWLSVLACAFGLEFLGIFRPGEATLTRLICDTLPVWLRAMLIGWLAYHFIIQNQ